ncbi:CNNM domain-containing protein [Haloarchaeobius sp. DYHT-AS-18]|uniref:CNNM domain-containing protein n=1 Tax=Haloarchaeobius sp. DYHT-AS-18 TaxID=3446117 RepID=UPI003EC0C0A8
MVSILWISAAAVTGLLACSAFFSSSETAIFSLSVEDIEADEASGDRRAARLAELREDPHRLLVTLLVGNNIVNMAISSVITVALVETVSAGAAVTVATLVASSVVLVFGEIVPKSYGLGNARKWARTIARPLYLVELALLPIVVVFDVLTRRLSGLLGGETALEEQFDDDPNTP